MSRTARVFIIAAHLVVAIAGIAGCAPSETEIKAQFAEYVADANQCQVAADCALATAECPLGCWVAVRADRKADVERKARELVDKYRAGGTSCVYDCVVPGPVSCPAGFCFAAAAGSPAAADSGAP